MKSISKVEYDILNALYFVEPLEHILDEVEADPNITLDALKGLIDNKLVVAMEYNEEKKDYTRSFIYDSDNMDQYQYLATREGLLLHTNGLIEDE